MVLLTGATGFVGGNLVKELIKDDRKIACLVRDPARAAPLASLGCALKSGDVTDRGSLDGAFEDAPEAVIHLVGILVESRGVSYESVHAEGTRNVVDACLRHGVKRYVHISALGAREGAPSRYHRTKWAAEEIIRASGLDYTIFRPSVIFGAEDRFTNVLARAIRLSPVIFIPGNGRNLIQPIFVKDLARAMASCIGMKGAVKRVFEVAGPRAYAFNEIVRVIADVMGRYRLKINVPMPLVRAFAGAAEAALSRPPITREALKMLEEDNVTDEASLEKSFGIKPTGFIEGLMTYLH